MSASVPGSPVPPGVPHDPEGAGGRLPRSALVVDDDPDVRAGLAGMLSRLGFEVRTADGPDGAMAALEEGDPLDLLVVDMIMPNLNGLVFARRVASRSPSVRVLYVSGLTSGEVLDREEGVAGIESAFLEKPIMLDELSEKVRKLFSGAD